MSGERTVNSTMPSLSSALATIVAGVGFYAYLLTNILWLQYVWGYSIVVSGLAVVPGALVAAILASRLGPIAQTRGYRLVIIPGAIIWALAYVWYVARVDEDRLGGYCPDAAIAQEAIDRGNVAEGSAAGFHAPFLCSACLCQKAAKLLI